ncbi:MAG TPA: M28 family peptidase [Anaeromyxobacteraceae bacterium]|nr:M28 family peptidase [Anaeromyxobacteraceae bacterium]
MDRRPPAAAAVALALAACASASAARAAPDAEAAIRPDDVARDVAWLAAPERTGRGVGTPGNEAAAAWIAERMRALGLKPAFPGGYLQEFEVPVGVKLAGRNALEVGGRTLAAGTEWKPFTFSDNGAATGELVWVGYGITAPELSYDDYAGVDVKGKVVLVAGHFPRESDPDSPFRSPRAYSYGEWRYKAMNARDHGAVAVVAVRDDWQHGGPGPLAPFGGSPSSPAGVLAAQATAGALGAAVDPPALARAGQEDGRPHSRVLAVQARVEVGIERVRARTANVAGLLRGADPALSAECVVVGAHYDHLGYGGENSLEPDVNQVHPGADDNASGVAALLAIARAFAVRGAPARTVLFAAFTAEEMGLLGSAQFVKAMPAACPLAQVQMMVNLDMVGRPRDKRVFVEGVDTARGLRGWVAALDARPPALPLSPSFVGDGYGPSDHTSFYAKAVPVLYFFTGAHADYHRPSDTADKVDPRGLAAVAQLAFRAAESAADAPYRIAVVSTPPPPGQGGAGGDSRGYGAYLGTIPDFGERSEPGVLLTGVRAGSPAEKAGVTGGDVILQVGGRVIGNLQDLTYALRFFRPGDEVEVVWSHAGERRAGRVVLGERK